MARLAVCMLNISEGRRLHIVEKVAKAAGNVQDAKLKCQSTVLNIFSDNDYNRSVLTIAASIDHLYSAVIGACRVAYNEINLQCHTGVHPRLGSVDLVPIYPISPLVSLSECGELAQRIGYGMTNEIPGTSLFWFGEADYPNKRGLVERRKEVGWYKGKHGMNYDEMKYDLGAPPTPCYGLTGIGASPYVMNCNITIDTTDLVVGRAIAKAIRGTSPGGLKGVQTMAFIHERAIEIACNVEAFSLDEKGEIGDELKRFDYTKPGEIKEKLEILAEIHGVKVNEMIVVGFTLEEIYHLAYTALSKGNNEAWKDSQLHRM